MGKYILGFLGMILSFLLIRYREVIGDMLGDADWMRKVGGVHNFIVIIALFIFFWALAEMTNTTQLFFAPLRLLFPFVTPEAPPPEF